MPGATNMAEVAFTNRDCWSLSGGCPFGQAMEIIAGHTLRLVRIAPVRDSRHHDFVFSICFWGSCLDKLWQLDVQRSICVVTRVWCNLWSVICVGSVGSVGKYGSSSCA